MKNPIKILFNPLIVFLIGMLVSPVQGQEIYVRYNQLGYAPEETKVLLLLSREVLVEQVQISHESTDILF